MRWSEIEEGGNYEIKCQTMKKIEELVAQADYHQRQEQRRLSSFIDQQLTEE